MADAVGPRGEGGSTTRVAVTACARRSGRIDTTIRAVWKDAGGRQAMFVRSIGTLQPCSRWRTGTPDCTRSLVIEGERSSRAGGSDEGRRATSESARGRDHFAIAVDAGGSAAGRYMQSAPGDATRIARTCGLGHVQQADHGWGAVGRTAEVEGEGRAGTMTRLAERSPSRSPRRRPRSTCPYAPGIARGSPCWRTLPESSFISPSLIRRYASAKESHKAQSAGTSLLDHTIWLAASLRRGGRPGSPEDTAKQGQWRMRHP